MYLASQALIVEIVGSEGLHGCRNLSLLIAR
jgi:hypothetical protein